MAAGLHLAVSVIRRLDDLGVHPHRGIVDEDAAIDLGKIDRYVDTVAVRVQRAWHVVAIKL